MLLYLILILAILFLILFSRINIKRTIYLKKLVLPLASIAFIFCLVIYSKTSLNAALRGINLCLNIVFPSLFPFFVGSEIIQRTGIIKAAGTLLEPVMRPLFNVPGCGSFALAMGIASGYPLGAKITTDMRKEKLLTKIEAERLLSFTNNSGPLFIIGAVAVGMFNSPELGLFLFSCHIAACISVGILFRFYKRENKKNKTEITALTLKEFKRKLKEGLKSTTSNFGGILGDAVRNSVNMILAIGGFIVFFSVIIGILIDTGTINYFTDILSFVLSPLGFHKDIVSSLICGSIEITTGTSMISKALNAPFYQQITVASIIIGWAGFSVHSQVLSIISVSDISIKPYLLGKLLQGIFAGIYTYIIFRIAGYKIFNTIPTYNPSKTVESSNWENYFLNAIKYFIIIFIALMILGLILSFFRYIFKPNKLKT